MDVSQDLRNPNVTWEEIYGTLRACPACVTELLENPAYDLLCIEKPYWMDECDVSVLWWWGMNIRRFSDAEVRKLAEILASQCECELPGAW